MAITKNELEEIMEVLRGIRGSHTELISVLIPAGYERM
jgi:peptide subunit release factor 1 (eRF1)